MAKLIETDIPCAACGYDLRGLTDVGRCPECGGDVAGSVEAFDERCRASADLLRSADSRWVRGIIEGMFFLSLAVVVGVTSLFLPLDFSIRRHREIAAGFTATYWVLSWFGVWKLSRIEPGAAPGVPGRTLSRSLRVCALLYASAPFVAGALPTIVVIILVLSIVPASILVYEVIRRLALRLPSMAIAVQARLLSFVMPFVAFLALMSHHTESRVPPTVFGMLDLVRPWVRDIIAGRFRMEPFYLLLLPSLAAALLPLEFLFVWVRGRRDAVMTTTPAAHAERTPASSLP
ncbi:MAG: hypothetical protein WBD40_05130 [Tepidisphaeraceae bacterium]